MRTTIDSAGRVVIPKPIRDALGLVGGTEVDIVLDGVSIRIDGREPEGPGLVERDGFLVIPQRPDSIELTVADVRRMRMQGYGLSDED
ncbi:MAG TPA: AbrB/MazE/SpoVT family DNA-binding domain-containing protein [Acidimicrobiales bacterium]|nr:AbrB/MazE/SpoVT family DNA-binding domain-containing protein [Acidimicrobiales bacterium]